LQAQSGKLHLIQTAGRAISGSIERLGLDYAGSSRVMKKGSLVGETPEIANDFVIPAEAGIQAFPQPIDIKAQDTGPRLSPG
jgi:hypothetical protein